MSFVYTGCFQVCPASTRHLKQAVDGLDRLVDPVAPGVPGVIGVDVEDLLAFQFLRVGRDHHGERQQGERGPAVDVQGLDARIATQIAGKRSSRLRLELAGGQAVLRAQPGACQRRPQE